MRILMSPPTFFEVSYVINPWMADQACVDRDLAQRQWDRLVSAIESCGATVEILPAVQGLPDLVFTANAAFVYDNVALTARYKHPERQGEEPHVEQWFAAHGFQVQTLPRGIPFEGAGDALIYDRRAVLAGYRQRTDIQSHTAISAASGLPVLSLELVNPRFYHVDVSLCPLARGHLLYYPGAFDSYGLQVLCENVPEAKRIPTTLSEASAFACNAVPLGPNVILHQPSQRLQDVLRSRGFRVVGVDLSEFLKAGGSAKCLTLRLD